MAKVNLNNAVKTIEVFYDAQCGMCRTFMEWLKKQERACELICLDYRSDEAQKVFPDLLNYHPEKEMVVRVDGEKVYQGGEGWVCCLWTCAKYRGVAKKINNRLLLPVAKKICHLVSRNRLGISNMLFRKKNADIDCDGGCEK